MDFDVMSNPLAWVIVLLIIAFGMLFIVPRLGLLIGAVCLVLAAVVGIMLFMEVL